MRYVTVKTFVLFALILSVVLLAGGVAILQADEAPPPQPNSAPDEDYILARSVAAQDAADRSYRRTPPDQIDPSTQVSAADIPEIRAAYRHHQRVLEQRRLDRIAEREAIAAAQYAAQQDQSAGIPAVHAAPSNGLPSLLLFIRSQESGGNYSAYNATGCSDENGTWSCGGAYQLSEQYASTWAAEAGFPGMSSQAQTWPAATQDAVAKYKFYASNPDGSLWCNYTDYC